MKLDLYEDTRAEFLLTGKARETTADSYCAVKKPDVTLRKNRTTSCVELRSLTVIHEGIYSLF